MLQWENVLSKAIKNQKDRSFFFLFFLVWLSDISTGDSEKEEKRGNRVFKKKKRGSRVLNSQWLTSDFLNAMKGKV